MATNERELSLVEYVCSLPKCSRVRKELCELLDASQEFLHNQSVRNRKRLRDCLSKHDLEMALTFFTGE